MDELWWWDGKTYASYAGRAVPPVVQRTRDAVAACECEAGCPSCVQSPKCGNGNSPLAKTAAVRVLDLVLAELPTGPR